MALERCKCPRRGSFFVFIYFNLTCSISINQSRWFVWFSEASTQKCNELNVQMGREQGYWHGSQAISSFTAFIQKLKFFLRRTKKANQHRNQGASAEPNVSPGTMDSRRATEHKQKINRNRGEMNGRSTSNENNWKMGEKTNCILSLSLSSKLAFFSSDICVSILVLSFEFEFIPFACTECPVHTNCSASAFVSTAYRF